MSKTTTPEQYDKLAALMATKLDIARGYHKRHKEDVQAFWEEVSLTLNSIGPPTKDVTAWKKVWIDWKCYIKRKLTNNKKEMTSTGGGHSRMQRISPLEEKVIQLTGLVTNTSGISCAEDFEVASALQEDARASEMVISVHSEDPADMASSSERRQQQGAKGSTLSLLKDLFSSQEAFKKDTKHFQESVAKKCDEMSIYMCQLNRNMERLADTTEKQLAEEQRHNKIMEELLKQKVEIKLQMLHF